MPSHSQEGLASPEELVENRKLHAYGWIGTDSKSSLGIEK